MNKYEMLYILATELTDEAKETFYAEFETAETEETVVEETEEPIVEG